MTLRAHFDGKVIVPEEPLDLPKDAPLELKVRRLPKRKRNVLKKQNGVRNGIQKRNGIPLARNDGVKMTAQEVAMMLDEV
jgi:hypothetical protein